MDRPTLRLNPGQGRRLRAGLQALRAGMRVGQLTFFEMRGARRPYRGRYADQDGAVPSRLWRDNLPG